MQDCDTGRSCGQPPDGLFARIGATLGRLSLLEWP